MSYDLLKSLLPYLEDYSAANTEDIYDLKQFAAHLYHATHSEDSTSLPHPDGEGMTRAISVNEIGRLLPLMAKYARLYFKKAMENEPISSPDEFGFLAGLFYIGSMTKTELITSTVTEIPSGMDIIKRLEKAGLIISYPDEQDRRATRVKLSDEGRRFFTESVLPRMDNLPRLVLGNLSPIEQKQLLHILLKLHAFHNPIYLKDRDEPLPVIIEKYL